eukprot:744118-Prorocentrum_minimum.AAC.1
MRPTTESIRESIPSVSGVRVGCPCRVSGVRVGCPCPCRVSVSGVRVGCRVSVSGADAAVGMTDDIAPHAIASRRAFVHRAQRGDPAAVGSAQGRAHRAGVVRRRALPGGGGERRAIRVGGLSIRGGKWEKVGNSTRVEKRGR